MVLIFDSHPVQYKAPVYRELERLAPGAFKTIYASDCSVRGHFDREFGRTVAWDSALLEGYDWQVLRNERGIPLSGFFSLSGRGIPSVLRHYRPSAVLLSQLLYASDFVTLISAWAMRIPVWVRTETQDEAFMRGVWKRLLRSVAYRLIYRFLDGAFYIGELNRRHFLAHSVDEERLRFSPYCVENRMAQLSSEEKHHLRKERRSELSIKDGETMVLFSGKLIAKKNPQLLIKALQAIGSKLRAHLVFVGTGELESALRRQAYQNPSVHFCGFVSQAELPSYYLAADILVLPSNRAGETWGLVVNEALHAGCSVVITEAVGCRTEFGHWQRVRVVPEDDVAACTAAIEHLAKFPRDFDWCTVAMQKYTVQAAAKAIKASLGG